ncbi:hypothetical protein SAMN05216573_113119 [Bradyrhizobium sp. Rc3b]|nr:hypothetical protein [Bradyrhizobium sp. SBR1B]SFN45099.1 hypothetical protein SAMN05216573_113119 [Bradyrhizobium sp. Rc3b]
MSMFSASFSQRATIVAALMRSMENVRRDYGVVVDELSAQHIVGENSSGFGGGEEYDLRMHLCEPVEHGGLVAEIDLAPSDRHESDVLSGEPAHECTTDHARWPAT